MPVLKKPQHDDTPTEVGQNQVQSLRDKHREQGYEGYSPSVIPNEKFALTSGPDSPSAYEQMVQAAEARLAELKEAGR
jgi:hypothetical protein